MGDYKEDIHNKRLEDLLIGIKADDCSVNNVGLDVWDKEDLD